MSTFGLILLIILFGTILYGFFHSLGKEADKIYDMLLQIEIRAVDAKTLAELEFVENDLLKLHNESCWHKNFGNRAMMIYQYIQGRKASFK